MRWRWRLRVAVAVSVCEPCRRKTAEQRRTQRDTENGLEKDINVNPGGASLLCLSVSLCVLCTGYIGYCIHTYCYSGILLRCGAHKLVPAPPNTDEHAIQIRIRDTR